jgi:uridine phosphorylase
MRLLHQRNAGEQVPDTQLILNEDGSVYHLGVKGEQIADEVWIVGDPDRVGLISSYFDFIDCEIHRREFVLHTGRIKNKRLSVVSSGIGVDNVEILIQELDAAVNVDPVTKQVSSSLRQLSFLRLGTCGSIRQEVPVGSLVASRYAIGYDSIPQFYSFEFSEDENQLIRLYERGTPWSPVYAVSCHMDLFVKYYGCKVDGITLTAPGFYAPQGRTVRAQSKRLDWSPELNLSWNNMQIVNLEMECAGLYFMSSLLGHKALTVCVVLANRANEQFAVNAAKEVEKLIQFALSRF